MSSRGSWVWGCKLSIIQKLHTWESVLPYLAHCILVHYSGVLHVGVVNIVAPVFHLGVRCSGWCWGCERTARCKILTMCVRIICFRYGQEVRRRWNKVPGERRRWHAKHRVKEDIGRTKPTAGYLCQVYQSEGPYLGRKLFSHWGIVKVPFRYKRELIYFEYKSFTL